MLSRCYVEQNLASCFLFPVFLLSQLNIASSTLSLLAKYDLFYKEDKK